MRGVGGEEQHVDVVLHEELDEFAALVVARDPVNEQDQHIIRRKVVINASTLYISHELAYHLVKQLQRHGPTLVRVEL